MRYVRFRAELQKVREAYPDLSLCVFEAAHHRGGHATQYALGCQATLEAWCAEHGIEHASVHSGQLKRFAAGSGRASKSDMVLAAQYFLGQDAPKNLSNDAADAVLLWRFACEELVG